nr:shikimate kinase [uncultured Catonella sp.]
MKNNITLIGMPGAGKSTVGVVLAKVMGYRFVDSDLVIQEKTGKLLSEIIAERGTEGFLQIEDEINAELDCKKSIIATGGSAVYCKNAMAHLKEISTVVYIKLPYEKVKKRLGSLKDRGVALKEGQTLKNLYEERCPLYEKYADIVVEADTTSVENCMRKIVEEIRH